MIVMENLFPLMEEIESVIRRLGAPGHYRGLPYLTRAVARVLEEPEAIHAVVKWVYAPVAQARGTTISAVERAIRTLRDHIWDRGNRELLDEMARYHLTHPPTSSELIDYIANYMRR